MDQPKVGELLPCPCGNMASFNITPRKAADITDEPLGYVSCPVCDIRTGARQSEAIAIGDWNAYVSRFSQDNMDDMVRKGRARNGANGRNWVK